MSSSTERDRVAKPTARAKRKSGETPHKVPKLDADGSSATTAPKPTDKRKKLGKGLGALLGETRREEPLARRSGSADQSSGDGKATDGLMQIPLARITPLAGQPRKHFDETALNDLAASISQRGVIQPIIVRPLGEGRYELVAGERRWRAAQRAQIHEIPAIVRDLEQREVMALALIENIQREDLNPIEEAAAYQRLAEDEGMTHAAIARLVDKSRSHVANLVRLLTLPPAVTELVAAGDLSMGHARALIGHESALALANRAVNEKLSVRQMERLARSPRQKANEKKTSPAGANADAPENADIAAVQWHLEEILGLQVRIRPDDDPRSGVVTIRYRTLDHLDLVCQRLSGGDV